MALPQNAVSPFPPDDVRDRISSYPTQQAPTTKCRVSSSHTANDRHIHTNPFVLPSLEPSSTIRIRHGMKSINCILPFLGILAYAPLIPHSFLGISFFYNLRPKINDIVTLYAIMATALFYCKAYIGVYRLPKMLWQQIVVPLHIDLDFPSCKSSCKQACPANHIGPQNGSGHLVCRHQTCDPTGYNCSEKGLLPKNSKPNNWKIRDGILTKPFTLTLPAG